MREMKDSGIEWIGEIPKEWEITKYKRFTENRMGETILAKDLSDKGIPVYSATQEDDIFGCLEAPKLKLPKDSLIIPARGASVGYAKIVTEEIATCTQTTICSTNIHDAVPKFLYYCCHGLRGYWFRYDGSAIPQVTVEQVDNNFVPTPPFSEQQSIVSFLDCKCSEIDALTADIETQIDTLEQYKRSVITEAVTKGLNPDAEMKDSGVEWIGEIPKEWNRIALLYVLRNNITDGPHETPNLVDDGIPFISVDSLNDSENIDLSVVKKFITEEDYQKYNRKANLQQGDILFSKAATIGKTAIVKDEKFMVWSPLAIIKVNDEICFNRYIYYVLNCSDLIIYVSMLGSYNTQINVGMRELEKAIVPFPPLSEQHAIADYLDVKCSEIDSIISDKRTQLDTLANYKKSLIYEYVTGKKEVPAS